jgi:hypothetical protein
MFDFFGLGQPGGGPPNQQNVEQGEVDEAEVGNDGEWGAWDQEGLAQTGALPQIENGIDLNEFPVLDPNVDLGQDIQMVVSGAANEMGLFDLNVAISMEVDSYDHPVDSSKEEVNQESSSELSDMQMIVMLAPVPAIEPISF